MIAFTCPHCGGSVHYDISERGVRCEYCQGFIDLASYQAYLDRKKFVQATELCCPQCGAVTLSYDNTLATFCSYCGSSVVFDRRVRETEKPAGMLPFKMSRWDALQHYWARVAQAQLAPDWMREEGELHLTGLYVPYYEYAASVDRYGRFKGTKTVEYGRDVEVSEYELFGTIRARYEGIRFDASVAFPDAMSETIDDFDWEECEEFQPGFVAGFYADGSDIGEREYDQVARGLIQGHLNSEKADHKGISVSLEDVANEGNVVLRREKVLLPVWLLTHRIGKDRICYGAVNGRTGSVAADIPLDKKKYLKLSLILAALINLILNSFITVVPSLFLGISMSLTILFGMVLGNLAQDVFVRDKHLDDIGRVGKENFVSALRQGRGEKGDFRPLPVQRSGSLMEWLMVLIPYALFVILYMFSDRNGAIGKESVILFGGIGMGLILRRGMVLHGRYFQGTASFYWKFGISKKTAFAALWKIGLALLAGFIVLIWGPGEEKWYYGAGILNIAVCIVGAFELIRKQNRLSSQEIPVFHIQRGGQA